MQPINVRSMEAAPAANGSVPSAEAGLELDLAVVFQNLTAREWASEMWGQVKQWLGKTSLSAASWGISDLGRPDLLAAAVQAAAQAEVILVAVLAAPELPLELYTWCDVWLPRRGRRAGVLMTLIGQRAEPSPEVAPTLDYFQAVARKGGLDFIPQARLLPPTAHGFLDHGATVPQHAGSPRGFSPLQEGPWDAAAANVGPHEHRHWGLNE